MTGDDLAKLTKAGKQRVYRMLCFLAWCDEELDPAERAALERYRAAFGLAEVEAAMLEAEGKGAIVLELGDKDAELRVLVDGLIDVAIADGELAIAEQDRLRRLGKTLGLPEAALVRHMSRRIAERGVPLRVERWEDPVEDEGGAGEHEHGSGGE
ncbi:MAG: TerB family tellurite resistance protein [Planctomycetota bacterium]